jgi:hypothetical protein
MSQTDGALETIQLTFFLNSPLATVTIMRHANCDCLSRLGRLPRRCLKPLHV